AVRDESWESDVERLIKHLPAVATSPVTVLPATAREPGSRLRRYGALASAVILAVAVVLLGRWWWTRETDRTKTPASPPRTDNRPPTTGKIEVGPLGGEGLMSATKFTFTVKGITDPDGDPLR